MRENMTNLVSGIHPFELVRRSMINDGYDVTGLNHKQVDLYLNKSQHNINQFVLSDNEEETLKFLCEAISSLVGYAYSKGWNVIGAFDEVIRFDQVNLAPYVRKPSDPPKPENMIMGLGEE
jgi:hypothetical protein